MLGNNGIPFNGSNSISVEFYIFNLFATIAHMTHFFFLSSISTFRSTWYISSIWKIERENGWYFENSINPNLLWTLEGINRKIASRLCVHHCLTNSKWTQMPCNAKRRMVLQFNYRSISFSFFLNIVWMQTKTAAVVFSNPKSFWWI